MNTTRTFVWGGLAAGLLDIVYACVVFGIRNKVPAMRIGQGIASHVLGLAAFNGGWGAAILGFVLHFAIAVLMALGLLLVCRKLPVVGRHVLAFAPLYGVFLYLVMTYAVLPLTAPKPGPYPAFPPAMDFNFASAMFAHIVLVAGTIALFAKRALKEA